MKKRLFPLLITLSALAVSASAAFYSVFGLSKLFAGASNEVIIMAGSLEFAKLVVASLLYQYWGTINKWLRSYLMLACFILMVITSGGIYGFLSGAYQSTATQSELLDKSLAILEQKQIRFEEQKTDLTIEKTTLNKSISNLRVSLSSPTSVSYYDKEAEQVITTTSSSTRRALQGELKSTIEDRDAVNLKLEAILDSIATTDIALLDKEIDNEDQRELGPLKYLSQTTGYPMNEVVNWFLLLIIFVFDPLAIALVVAANMAFSQLKKKEPEVKMSVPDGLEFDTPYTMEEVSEAFGRQDKKDKELTEEYLVDEEEINEEYFHDLEEYLKYTQENEPIDDLTYPQFVEKHYPPEVTIDEKENLEIDEDRMNIIGQNGNDGLHYDEKDIPLDRLTDTTQTLIVDRQEDIRVIKSNEDLKEEELIELSKEVGKKEVIEELEPINPTEKDLEKLAQALNISKKEEDDENRTLRYKGR
tara:strand:+ start:775 stop:2196 length:1422 start_codon:yes stop_codon:yes gene_type:complete